MNDNEIKDTIMNISQFDLSRSKTNKSTTAFNRNTNEQQQNIANDQIPHINVAKITSHVPLFPNTNFSSLQRLIKGTDSDEKTQHLLQGALSAISESYKTSIAEIHKMIKQQKRIIQTAIKNIDEQMFALSQQKKQFKIELSEFNKDGNIKIDELA